MTWEKGSNVQFKNSRVTAFLDRLATVAGEQGYTIYVTSGYRSPEDQARVVCENYQNTAGANLSVYGTQTRSMYQTYCPSDMEKLVEFERQKTANRIANDPTYQSHGTGDAVDISIANLTHAQRVHFKSIIEELGAEVLWETSPLHFHIWLRDFKPPSSNGLLLLSVVGLSVGTYLLWRQ